MEALLVNNELKTSSRIVAEVFGKAHRSVLRNIRNLESSDDFNQHNFVLIDFKDDKGRTFQEYEMTRDGFSILVMGFTGKKAMLWKEKFLKAFNAMERELLKTKDTLEWKAARLQGKNVRRSITDSIKDFVAYAETQGSRSARMYYANITNMEYKALGMLEQSKSVKGSFRDTLNLMDLCFLQVAENIAKLAIQAGMDDGIHYKDIYALAKDKVEDYAKSVIWTRAIPKD